MYCLCSISRKAELLEKVPHPILVLRNVWVDLAIGAFEPSVRNHTRAAMAGDGSAPGDSRRIVKLIGRLPKDSGHICAAICPQLLRNRSCSMPAAVKM